MRGVRWSSAAVAAVPARVAQAPRPRGVLALQQAAGNHAVAHALQRLTETERFENLVAPRYAGSVRLQSAFDNQPAMGAFEPDHEAVRLVQRGLVKDGFPLPKSTRPDGTLDGVFAGETASAVAAFQRKHQLPAKDGRVGRQVLRRLDELEIGGVGPDSNETQRRHALAESVLLAQQDRVRALIRNGLALRPAGTAPDRRDVLFRNACEWIDRGRADVHVMVRTHDSPFRAGKPGAQNATPGTFAYFDSATTYPGSGGTYPINPGPGEERHVSYAPGGFHGVTVNSDVELLDVENRTDEALKTTILHEVQHIADRAEGQTPARPEGPGRVKMFDSAGRPDLQLEGHVNVYQTEFRAHWIEHPEGDPADRYGSSTEPATNARPVVFADPAGTTRQAVTNFKNLRQEKVFFDLVKNGYEVAGPYTSSAQFKKMADDYALPAGVNLVDSVRVDDLLDAVSACGRTMTGRHPSIVAMLASAGRLDEPDRRFLRDRRLSKPFWDNADRHLSEAQTARLVKAVGP